MNRSSFGRVALGALGVILLTGATLARGAEAPQPAPPAKPAAARSLDQELLKDLDNELLDDALSPGEAKRPGKKPAADSGKRPAADPAHPDGDKPADAAKPGEAQPKEPAPGGAKPGEPAAQPGDDELMGEDIGLGPEDPLARIGQQMRKVERLIEQQKAAQPSEALRQQIVQELAKLIDELEQQRRQQSGSAGKSSKPQALATREMVKQSKQSASKPGNGDANQPARDSTDQLRRGEVQRPDPEQMKGMMKDLWGQLPAHAREQMLQTSPEQFVPRYELQIEKYYKRLAEQQKHNP